VQDAEFIVATDAGFGGTHSTPTVCALTNLPSINCMVTINSWYGVSSAVRINSAMLTSTLSRRLTINGSYKAQHSSVQPDRGNNK
jgi:hypothetical protein